LNEEHQFASIQDLEAAVAPYRMSSRFVLGSCITVVLILGVVTGVVWSLRNRTKLPPQGVSLREYQLAAKAFTRRYRTQPDHTDIVSWLAESAVAANDLDRALNCFAVIPSSHLKYGRFARLQQGEILLRLKRAATAEHQFREFLQLERVAPQSPPDHVDHALHQLRHILEVQLRFEERHTILSELISRKSADTFETLAFCFPTLFRWNGSQAQAWLEEFWQADAENFQIRVALARYRTGNGRLDEAHNLLDSCLAERPNDRHAVAALVALRHEEGDWDQMAQLLATVPPEESDPWLLMRLRGHVLNHDGRFVAAAEQFRTALRIDPACAECYVGLADALAGQGQAEPQQSALATAQQLARIQNRLGWLDTEPDRLEVLLEVAQIARQIGLIDAARAITALVLRKSPYHAEASDLWARLSIDAAANAAKTPTVLAPNSQSEVAPNTESQPVRDGKRPTHRGAASPLAAGTPPRFRRWAADLGLSFTRDDDIRGLHRIMESTGGGVAVLDYDLDGWVDLLFTNGCRLPRKERTNGHANDLFRNQSGHRVDRVTKATRLMQHGYFQGCAVGDVDGDGFDDLFLTSFGRHILWQNVGDGTFRDATMEFGIDIDTWGTSAAFADFNRDGHLDLFVTSYIQTTDDLPKLCPNRNSPDGYVQCPPTAFRAADDMLLVSDGRGRLRDVTQTAGITAMDGKGLGVVVFDVDRDGWLDVFVANDGTPNFLYLNRTGNGPGPGSNPVGPLVPKFDDQAAVLGVAVDREGKAVASMGIACGDTDGDGWPDLLITTFFGETSTFFRNQNGVGFVDDSLASGLGPPTRSTLGFGTEFLDCDNDGWLDVFIANGHVDDVSWGPGHEPYRMPPQLFHNNRRGRFSEVSLHAGDYFQRKWLGRGVAVADLDNDGDLDFAVSHQLDPSEVLRNDTASPHRSVIVKLVGQVPSNRSAIGARVEADGLDVKVVREIIGGGSYLSSSDRRVHVGLGSKSSLPRMRIVWPSGTTDEFEQLAPGHYVVIEGGRLEQLPVAP
jgi:tetratricopeptide (TPR) repeat protein